MKIKEIIQALEKWAPTQYAEDFDNVGLQLGNAENEIYKALVAFEITDEVIQEAIDNKAGLIICFHPLIFNGLKSITGKNRVEQIVIKAIQNNIAIYAIHTNLDAQLNGVNGRIAKELGLKNTQILIPNEDILYKLIFFVPKADADKVKDALFNAEIGKIGNYSECSFNSEGIGTFKPIENANPTLGEIGKQHQEAELKVEILVKKHQLSSAISIMKQEHPYEEVAYDVIPLNNNDQTTGMGQVGELQEPMTDAEFLRYLKSKIPTEVVRHSKLLNKEIKKVAILGGSGAFAINAAKSARADVLVTADLKYHDFFLAENQILLCDVGHYESEQFNKFHITDYLSEIFSNFAFLTSNVNTNPINYFK
ncbi:Nif3-like dinuclear metal center hexameric protein [Weeksellaceae bacterium TAE3-ERU29]|nr:Nif3-like dinuclear metal center hexameric protein [Weeksellaceae bacterium TAE3-ERU29]